ncbi:MAG: hypothetical protein WC076_00475 [Terrimicrobiaceae bacterium]|nr:hypothetical protein [Terrimicrobiaceae bacterium]
MAPHISEEAPPAQRPPDPSAAVTFFRPIKTGEAGLRKNLAIFLCALEPGDQVIFSATAPGELRLCEELAAEHPGPDILCLRAVEGIHRNPKINKLAQMEPMAAHEKWIVLDSDTIPDRGFLHRPPEHGSLPLVILHFPTSRPAQL